MYDVFRVDGRFMGTVANPPNSVRTPVFRGDHIISYVEDEAGLGMVKCYRLVLPGER